MTVLQGKKSADKMESSSSRRTIQQSELVSPREFLMSWGLEALEASRMQGSVDLDGSQDKQNRPTSINNIAHSMGVSIETALELEEVCSKKTLFCGDEPKQKTDLLQMTTVPDGVALESVTKQMEVRKRRAADNSCRVTMTRSMKYNNMDEIMAMTASPDQQETLPPEFCVPVPNVVLTVEISKCLLTGESNSKNRSKETFLVLGSQTLAQLRDKIKCPSDVIIPGDYSSMPDLDPCVLTKSGDLYKSSYFFIENVFYNDTRLADNKDYSKPVLAWAKERMPGVDMTVATMQDTVFYDLKIRLGHHYPFVHQGDCQHSLLISDLRLFNGDDNQDLRIYPHLFMTRMKNRTICQGCTKLTARWVVKDSPLIPVEPGFLCRICLKTLLYTKDGEKRGRFKAFHYSDYAV